MPHIDWSAPPRMLAARARRCFQRGGWWIKGLAEYRWGMPCAGAPYGMTMNRIKIGRRPAIPRRLISLIVFSPLKPRVTRIFVCQQGRACWNEHTERRKITRIVFHLVNPRRKRWSPHQSFAAGTHPWSCNCEWDHSSKRTNTQRALSYEWVEGIFILPSIPTPLRPYIYEGCATDSQLHLHWTFFPHRISSILTFLPV